MKFYKCCNCQVPFKIDESKIKQSIISVPCFKCGFKNTVRLGVFLVIQNKNELNQIPLKLGSITIGRKSSTRTDSFLYISDEFVSRNHALITASEKEGKFSITIEDLNSTNGTFDQNKKKLEPNIKTSFLKDAYFIVGLSKIYLKIY